MDKKACEEKLLSHQVRPTANRELVLRLIAESDRAVSLSDLEVILDTVDKSSIFRTLELFVKHGIYTREEINARSEIHIENYINVISIEANTMIDMIRHDILPAVSAFGTELCQRAAQKESAGVSCRYEKDSAKRIGDLTDELLTACQALEADMAAVPSDASQAMHYCHDVVLADMGKARQAADQLELLTDADYWPFPPYSELLFSV